jgi:superfamily I DNA/RNA helicase
LEDRREYTLEDLTRDHGLLRTDIWHDALSGISLREREYYLTILRRHGSKALTAPPRAHVNTIHGVKGGEADNVLLMSDMARKTHQAYQLSPDDERRVFYVGATRARQRLIVCTPQTASGFSF